MAHLERHARKFFALGKAVEAARRAGESTMEIRALLDIVNAPAEGE